MKPKKIDDGHNRCDVCNFHPLTCLDYEGPQGHLRHTFYQYEDKIVCHECHSDIGELLFEMEDVETDMSLDEFLAGLERPEDLEGVVETTKQKTLSERLLDWEDVVNEDM